MDGDENSKTFHSMIRRKRRKLAISGIMVDGFWVTNLSDVKSHFLHFLKNKFHPFDGASLL